jgi:hypothetical protein
MAKSKKSVQTGTYKQTSPSWFDTLSSSKRDLICVLVLYLFIVILFNKIVFQNMVFSDSGDTAAAESWQQAGTHLRETENIEPLWFPYIFSGMPGFGSLAYAPRDVNYLQIATQVVGRLLFLNGDVSWILCHFFLAGVGMFLLARYLKFSQLPALLAALTLMLNPYFLGLAEAGQGSKLIALSYVPFLFLLTHNLFQRRDVLSFGLLAAAIGTQLLAYHVQMVFYTFLILGLYFLYDGIVELRKQPRVVLMRGALFAGALLLGLAIASYVYLTVAEYSGYSIRGSGEVGIPGGLTYEYATNWSFHPFEMMNYLIPSFFGYSSSYLTDYQGQQMAMPLYWGWMPFTDSTMYLGIVSLFLGLTAVIFKREKLVKFLALLTVVIFLLAFGKHLPFLYNLMFNYFPFFNKFRVPGMILHLVPFVFGILAAYGLRYIMDLQEGIAKVNIAVLRKRLIYVAGGLGGLLLIASAAKSGVYSSLSSFMFVRQGDLQQYGQQALAVFKQKRFDVMWDDYVKFTFLAVAFFLLIWLYLSKKLQATTFVLAVIAMMVIDLYIYDIRYINPKPNTASKEHFQADETVQFLQADSSVFRVYPITHDLFMDNTYMYHCLQSVGGYSPAKLRIYQEVLDSLGIDPPQFPIHSNILDMLNVKYIVAPGRLPEEKYTIVNADQAKSLLTYTNPGCLPRAFFVDEAVVVTAKKELFSRMREFNPRHTALLEKVPATVPQHSDSTSVQMVHYGAHDIELSTYSSATSLLVLSEVYYPAGWKAFIDGGETEIYKTNYILRSIVVPAGKHTVAFKFDPPSYHLGFTVTHAGWGVTVLLIAFGLYRLPQVQRKLGRQENAEVKS